MEKPNIIFIHLDQWHPFAISALGENKYVKTPHIDRILRESHSFENAISTCPTCMPARTSWYTGTLASEHNCLNNELKLDDLNIPTLSSPMRERDYNCFYIGKWHIEKPLDKEFDILNHGKGVGEIGDNGQSRSAVGFLNSYDDSEKSFFLNIGLLNPHDCCFLTFGGQTGFEVPTKIGIENTLFTNIPKEELENNLPPLPVNFDKVFADKWLKHWNEEQRRLYLYYYYRLTEKVDAQVGRIYNALQNSKFAKNTYFILTADHGDMNMEFGMGGKGRLENASVKVPLLISGPNIKKGFRDRETVVGSADIGATILDLAGAKLLPRMKEIASKSFKNVLFEKAYTHRKYTISEIYSPKAPAGIGFFDRAFITKERKYILHYSTGEVRVFDHMKDRWEMNDLSKNPEEQEGINEAIKFSDYLASTLPISSELQTRQYFDNIKNFARKI